MIVTFLPKIVAFILFLVSLEATSSILEVIFADSAPVLNVSSAKAALPLILSVTFAAISILFPASSKIRLAFLTIPR